MSGKKILDIIGIWECPIIFDILNCPPHSILPPPPPKKKKKKRTPPTTFRSEPNAGPELIAVFGMLNICLIYFLSSSFFYSKLNREIAHRSRSAAPAAPRMYCT